MYAPNPLLLLQSNLLAWETVYIKVGLFTMIAEAGERATKPVEPCLGYNTEASHRASLGEGERIAFTVEYRVATLRRPFMTTVCTISDSLPAFFHLVEISDNVSLISCSSVEASPLNVPCAKIFFIM